MLVTASDDSIWLAFCYDNGRKLLKSGATRMPSGRNIVLRAPCDGVAGYKFIIQTADMPPSSPRIRETLATRSTLPTRRHGKKSAHLVYVQEDYYWNGNKWFDSDIAPVSATAVGEYADLRAG